MAEKNFSSKGSMRALQNELKKSFQETLKEAATEAFEDVEIDGELDGKKVKVKGSSIKNEVQKQLSKNLEKVTVSPEVEVDPDIKVASGTEKKIQATIKNLAKTTTIQPEVDLSKTISSFEELKSVMTELEDIYSKFQRPTREKKYNKYDEYGKFTYRDLISDDDFRTAQGWGDADNIDKTLESEKKKLLEIYKLYKNVQSAIKNHNGWFKDQKFEEDDLEQIAIVFKTYAQSYHELVTEYNDAAKRMSGGMEELGMEPKTYEDLESVTSKMTKNFKGYVKEVIEDSAAVKENNRLYEEEVQQIQIANKALNERYNLLRKNVVALAKSKGDDVRSRVIDIIPFINDDWDYEEYDNMQKWGAESIFRDETIDVLQEVAKALGIEIPQAAEKAKESIEQVINAGGDKDTSATATVEAESGAIEQLKQKYLELIKVKEKLNDLSVDLGNVFYLGADSPSMETLEKNGFVNLIKEYYDEDQADAILKELEKDVRRFNRIENTYYDESQAQNFLDSFKEKSFDEQLAIFDKIAKKSKRIAKETRENFEQISKMKFLERGDIEFVLDDGKTEKASSIMDLGDTFGLYEQIRDKIKSINIVDTWKDSTREQLDSMMEDFYSSIMQALEPITEKIHDKIQEAFTFDDHMLSTYNEVLNEYDKWEPFDGDDRYSSVVIANREKIQQGLAEAFKGEMPQELIKEYNKIWDSIDSDEVFPNLEQAIERVNTKAAELGYSYDASAKTWIKAARQEVEATNDVVEALARSEDLSVRLREENKALKEIESSMDSVTRKGENAYEAVMKARGFDPNTTTAIYDADKIHGAEKFLSSYGADLVSRKEFDAKYDQLIEIVKKYFIGDYGISSNLRGNTLEDFLKHTNDLRELSKLRENGIKGVSTENLNQLFRGAWSELYNDHKDIRSSSAIKFPIVKEIEEYKAEMSVKFQELYDEYQNKANEISKLRDEWMQSLMATGSKKNQGSTEQEVKSQNKVQAEIRETAETVEQEATSHEKNEIAIRQETAARKASEQSTNANETATEVEKETVAAEEAAPAFEKAAKSKKKFTDENKKAAAQASSSTDLILKEANAAGEASDEIKTLADVVAGYIRNQRGDASTGTFTYTEALTEVADMQRIIKDGVVVSEELRINYDKLTKKLIDADESIITLTHRVAAAQGEEKEKLQQNLDIMKNQRAIYQDLYDYMQQDGHYAITDKQQASFRAQRYSARQMVENELVAKEIVAKRQEEERVLQETQKIERGITEERKKQANLDIDQQKASLRLDDLETEISKDTTLATMFSSAIKDVRNNLDSLSGSNGLKDVNAQIQYLSNNISKAQAIAKQNRTGRILDIDKDNKLYSLAAYEKELNDLGLTSQNTQQKLSDLLDLLSNVSDATGMREFNSSFKNFKLSMEASAKAAKAANNVKSPKDTRLDENLSKQKTLYGQIYAIDKKIVNINETEVGSESRIKALQENRAELLREVLDLYREQKALGITAEQQAKQQNELQDIYLQKQREINEARGKNQGDLISDISDSADKLKKKLKLGKGTEEYTRDLNDTLDKVNDLLSRAPTMDLSALRAEWATVGKAVDDAIGDGALAKNKAAAQSSLEKLRKSIEDIEQRNSAMGASFRAEFDNLKLEIDTAKSTEDVEKLKAEIVKLEGKLIAAGKTGKSAFQQLGEAVRTSTRQFIAQYLSLQDFVRYAREGFQTVVEVDTALTELRKVSDASDERLAQSFQKSTETAKELGATISDVIGVTADWARLGYNVDQAEELARVTTLFQTVGDNMTAEDTSSYLISTLQGFQMATSQAEEIADKYNEVANNFAIDTKGIGEALQRSAASFNAANTDLSEAIALVTTTNTVVQDPASVGTLWKTMSARVRGAKAELEELGEEEDTIVESTSKLRDLVKGMTGFDIMEDEDTFKSIYDIILGIGKEWDRLSDIDRAALGEALAGKRNMNALFAVLNNIETLENAYNTALKSQGSAQKEQENYAKSIAFSIGQMKAAAQEFWTTFIESGTAKAAVDLLTKLLNLLTEITKETHGIATLGGAGLIGILGHNPEIIGKLINSLAKDMGIIPTVADEAAGGMAKFGTALNGIKTTIGKVIASPLTPWILAGTAAVVAAVVAWDAFTTTVKEAQADLDKTSDKIGTLKSEIQELYDIDYRTDEQEKRLENLEKELEFQEKIYEIEQKRLAKEKFGKKFSDIFDADNYYAQYLGETNHQNADSVVRQFDLINKYQKQIANKSRLKTGYESWLNNEDLSPEEIEEYKLQIDDLSSSIDDLNGKNLSIVDELSDKASDFEKIIEEGQEAIDKGWVIGTDKANVQSVINEYQKLYDEIHNKIDPILKENGLFDYSSTINSVFDHVEFDGLKEKLVAVAKEGSLSIEYLTNNFSGPDGLIEALKEAGVDVEDLYKYLLRVSGLVDRQNLVRKIAGSNNYYDDRGFKTKAGEIKDYIDTLSEEDAQIVANLDIDWSTFSADEAIKKMQAEIDKAHGNPLEVGVTFDQSKFSEQVNKLDALQSAYNTFAQNVANKETKINLDISDVESLREEFGEIAGFDFDEFELVITSDTSGADDIQRAFDKALTAYANQKIALEGITEANKDMIRTQLEMEGATAESAQKFVDAKLAMAQAEQFTAEQGLELTNVTASQITALTKLGQVTPIVAQQLALLAMQEQLVNGISLQTTDDVQALMNLARVAGFTAAEIQVLNEVMSMIGQADAIESKSGVAATEIRKAAEQKLNNFNALVQEKLNANMSIAFDYDGAIADAGKAGGEAADAYVEAFQNEKEKLERDRDMGLISEKEYLDKLRQLIDKFFKDRAEYAENYMDEMKDYMSALMSYYNSVVSGVTTLLDHKISKLEKQKDKTVTSLQEEQEAAEEAYQAQIDAIQAEIDALDDLIDAKNEEIDRLNDQIQAIEDANAARDRSIQLQKAEYELQRAMHQRTKLVCIYARGYSNIA